MRKSILFRGFNCLWRYSLLFLCLLFLYQCNSCKNTSDKNGLLSYTSTSIPTDGDVFFVFSNRYFQNIKEKNISYTDLIKFTPKAEGEFSWDNTKLVFSPSSNLKEGQQYSVKICASEVFKGAKDFSIQFSTFQQDLTVNNLHLESSSSLKDGKQEDKYFRLKGSIETANPVSETILDNIINISGLVTSPHISYDILNSRTAFFIVDSIPKLNHSYKIKVYWNGQEIGANEKGEKELLIPKKGDFNVVNYSLKQGIEQEVVVYFSQDIDESQNLSGLVRLINSSGVKTEIQGNKLLIWPNETLSGDYDLQLFSGIKSKQGNILNSKETISLKFLSLKPSVRLLNEKPIIPENTALSFPFQTVSLRAVDVEILKIYSENIDQFLQINELYGNTQVKRVGRPVYYATIPLTGNEKQLGSWNTYSLSLSKIIELDPKAIYQIKFSFNKDYALYDCDGVVKTNPIVRKEVFDTEGLTKNINKYWDNPDLYYLDNYPSGYKWRDRDNPCKTSYYTDNRFPVRNILVSNLGVICKSSEKNALHIYVSDLSLGTPLTGAKLEITNYQNHVIGTASSDDMGFAEIQYEGVPFLLRASLGEQQTWLKLTDGNALSVSSFDVGGEKLVDGIKAFVYGERGVWRPGDSIFLTSIIRDKKEKLPLNFPVTCELRNPGGLVYDKQVLQKSENGMYVFKFKTDSEAPSGNWKAVVGVGDVKFAKTIRIETVKPNRLKVDLQFPNSILESFKDEKINVSSTWLQGGPAKGLKVEINLSLNAKKNPFDMYKQYWFEDIRMDFGKEKKSVLSQKLDDKGKASFVLKKEINKKFPGLMNATFTSRVFEKGGDFSIVQTSQPYSPYISYVGILLDKGDNYWNAYSTGENCKMPVVVVDASGRLVNKQKLKLSLYRIDYSWWWDHSASDLGKYSGKKVLALKHSKTLTTNKGKAEFNLQVSNNDYGYYLVLVENLDSGHKASKVVYFDYPYAEFHNKDGKGAAERLVFTSDKEKYNIGDKAKVSFNANSNSKALVTVSSGNSIISQQILNCQNGVNHFELGIEAFMEPNVYVSIELLQALQGKKNDVPLRLYGVISLSVFNENTILKPIIESSGEFQPNKEVEIVVGESNGKEMAYTLAVVEEGLLDLTSFKTPNPWNAFFTKEAFSIKTWDIYDMVNGVYNGKILQHITIGGDEESRSSTKKVVNRFKPVVKFFGPVKLEAGTQNTHKFIMPNYIGSVRVMVVAAGANAFGKIQKSVPVKTPLMILGTLPRILSPGEKVELPVSVFVSEKDIKEVKIKAEVSTPLNIVSSNQILLKDIKEGENTASFRLDVDKFVGTSEVKITAQAGKNISTWKVPIEIRNPNAYISKLTSWIVNQGNDKVGLFQSYGIPKTNSLKFSVSKPDELQFGDRLDFLIHYPYGCVEQTVSSVFPQLLLDKFVDLSEEKNLEIQNNLDAAFARLRNFVLYNGTLSYWPGGSFPNEWGTLYALHFMQLAKDKGIKVPSSLFNRVLNAVSTNNFFSRGNSYYLSQQFQVMRAYRLFVLSLCGKPNFAGMNRLKSNLKIKQAADLLTLAYIYSGRPEIGREIEAQKSTLLSATSYEYRYSTFSSNLRDQAIQLLTLIALKDEKAVAKAIDLIQKFNSEAYMSTQTTAWIMYVVSEFKKWKGEDPSSLKFLLDVNDKEEKIDSRQNLYNKEYKITDKESKISFSNLSKGPLYVQILQKGQPLIDSIKPMSNNLGLKVNYKNTNGESIDISKLKQGTDFVVEINIKNMNTFDNYSNIALTNVVPSGWEILNSRLFSGLKQESNAADYMDIRDDRINLFFDLRKNEIKTFKFLLNASYKGTFYLPPVKCEAMYEENVEANTEGKWVKVY
ncbi:MAG: alpha-2-macroglobulin [Bacteroidales bacterium]